MKKLSFVLGLAALLYGGGAPAQTQLFSGGGPSLKTFSTNFPSAENPISLGGQMITSSSPGVSWVWTPVIVASPGNAEALDYNQTGQNDALAVNVGTWRPDQGGSVTVGPFAAGGPAPSEFEIHFRTDPATGAGYEITWGYLGTYKIIVIWFANGNFTYVLNDTSPGTQLVPGDVLTATIIGNTITMYTNGVQVEQATDGTYTTGNPGFGFNGGGNPSAFEYSISHYSTWEID